MKQEQIKEVQRVIDGKPSLPSEPIIADELPEPAAKDENAIHVNFENNDLVRFIDTSIRAEVQAPGDNIQLEIHDTELMGKGGICAYCCR